MTSKWVWWGLAPLVVLIVLLGRAEEVHACSPQYVENWWFSQSYEFDTSQLPDGIDIWVDYEGSDIGRLLITNDRDEEWWRLYTDEYDANQLRAIAKNTPRKIAEIEVDYYINAWPIWSSSSFGPSDRLDFVDLIAHNDWQNHDDAGGIKLPAPDPYASVLLLMSNDVLYSVPYTITYEINTIYDPHKIVPPTTLADVAIAAPSIVYGRAIGATTNSEIYHDQVIGTAIFQVDEWIKGDGLDVIHVGYFGRGTDCGASMSINNATILFLGDQYTNDSYHLIKDWGWYDHSTASPRDLPDILVALDLPLSSSRLLYERSIESILLILGSVFVIGLLIHSRLRG